MTHKTTAEIRDMLSKVQSGEIEPYEENTPEWAEELYEMCDKQEHIREDGVLAALVALDDNYLDEGQAISLGKFETFMEEAYKQKHDGKAAWAKEQAFDMFDTDTLERMEDYINWSDYAESFTDAYHFIETDPKTVYVFDADFEF